MISAAPWLLLPIFLCGLLLGSFLNVCIARLPRHESIAWPGSHCPRCGAAIRPWDNVPLLSYALLRGRCRDCRKPISWRYPLVEAALGGLLVSCALRFASLSASASAGVFCFLLLGLFAMDLETYRLPDAFTLIGTGLGIAAALVPGASLVPALQLLRNAPFTAPPLPTVLGCCLAATLGAGLLLLIRWVYFTLRKQEGLGLGDVKMAALLGAWLGVTGLVLSLAAGVLLAALVGVTVGGKGKGRMARLPLGAFLAVGGLVTLFGGRPILAWYFHFWP